MDTFKKNLEAVKLAKRGSDLYGVLEKTAFYLHTMRPDKSSDENWFNAQEAIAINMSDYSYTKQSGEENPAEFISEFLKRRANEMSGIIKRINRALPVCRTDWHYNEKQEDIWEITQNYFAQAIAEVYISVLNEERKGYSLSWWNANKGWGMFL